MQDITILDGGMGRELKRTGAPFDHPYWSAQALWEAPEAVYQAHCRFIEAGAQVITVNSYACVPFHLGETRYQQQGPALAAKAAEIAREAVNQYPDKQVQVAGSLPPPMGSYRPDLFEATAALEIYQELLLAQAPFCDLFIVETLASLEELRVVQLAAQQTSKPLYYAFSLQDEPAQGALLRSGQSVASAVALVCSAPLPAGIAFNCSVPEVMAQALTETQQLLQQQSCALTVGVYANNFVPIPTDYSANSESQPMRELSPEDYLQYVRQWAELGATLIGGCCGIGPEHIRALAQGKHS
ncbi:homocysteine S-methyltransferase family protein [Salinimonas marina]|uniref:Homocysteine S-methyltransferase family protein n=1 Tax=Salinimonas marina TaxID=2785918 RepID=A0A7S9DX94_9ALTE|nr:homocysteine S-methyltransferase family protein [Salinimonas marina]QPG05649.1 homocysteine S-methyltransferase family protein [Salinimonas marina]